MYVCIYIKIVCFLLHLGRRADAIAMRCNATGDHVTEFSTKSSRRRCRRAATSGGCTAGICLGEEWMACHSVFWGVLLSLVFYAMASGLHNFGAAQRIEDAGRQRTQVVLREASARVGTMRRANVGWPASFPQFKSAFPNYLQNLQQRLRLEEARRQGRQIVIVKATGRRQTWNSGRANQALLRMVISSRIHAHAFSFSFLSLFFKKN